MTGTLELAIPPDNLADDEDKEKDEDAENDADDDGDETVRLLPFTSRRPELSASAAMFSIITIVNTCRIESQ